MSCLSMGKIFEAGDTVKEGFAKEIKDEIEESGIWSKLYDGVVWNSTARVEKNDGTDPKYPLDKHPFVT